MCGDIAGGDCGRGVEVVAVVGGFAVDSVPFPLGDLLAGCFLLSLFECRCSALVIADRVQTCPRLDEQFVLMLRVGGLFAFERVRAVAARIWIRV